MENMAENNPQEKLVFNATCFSTNNQSFGTISVMKQYFMSTECSDISYIKNVCVKFNHKLLAENGTKVECQNTYIEIYPLSNTKKTSDKNDCYIIFFDLEFNESLIELNKILNYINIYCDTDKKIYLITIYTNEKNIKKNLTEENIKVYFGKYFMTNYDISMVNMDSTDEIVKVIDSLTEDTLQEKNLLNVNKNLDIDKSKSHCLLI